MFYNCFTFAPLFDSVFLFLFLPRFGIRINASTWAPLGAIWAPLGAISAQLDAILAQLGAVLAPLGTISAQLDAILAQPGAVLAQLSAILAQLCSTWRHLGSTWRLFRIPQNLRKTCVFPIARASLARLGPTLAPRGRSLAQFGTNLA